MHSINHRKSEDRRLLRLPHSNVNGESDGNEGPAKIGDRHHCSFCSWYRRIHRGDPHSGSFGAGRYFPSAHLSAKQSPAEPFVIGYWRGKFEGILDSESDLEKQFESDAKVTANGQLNFSRASVHDVQALKQIAVVTRHPQFEHPKIDILRFRYRLNGDRLEVSNFEGEIRGLCRLEGEFSIERGDIDGRFKVGAAPEVVEAFWDGEIGKEASHLELLEAGIKIYEYEPTMVHVKLLVVDDTFVSVGSGNFDNRSIRLNDEANLDVLDRQFAAEQTRFFEMDKRQSHEVTLEEASGFHFANPLEHLAGLFSPQL